MPTYTYDRSPQTFANDYAFVLPDISVQQMIDLYQVGQSPMDRRRVEFYTELQNVAECVTVRGCVEAIYHRRIDANLMGQWIVDGYLYNQEYLSAAVVGYPEFLSDIEAQQIALAASSEWVERRILEYKPPEEEIG